MEPMHLVSRAASGAFFMSVLAFSIAALPAGPAAAQTIYACLTKDGDLERVTTLGPRVCKKHQTPIQWNVQGPQGIQGIQGPPGPKGDKGDPGEAGEGIKRAFVTSSVHDGGLGGLSGADAICNARAQEAGLAGKFVAWLCTFSVNAKDRISDRTWHDTSSQSNIIAHSKSDLIDGSLENPLRYDENGQVPDPPAFVWTGTQPDGTSRLGFVCGNWNNLGDIGANGDSESMDSNWTTNQVGKVCGDRLRLYCFQL
jgi:hypothetical protein